MTIEDVISVIIICVLLVIFLGLIIYLFADFLKSREGRRMVRSMKDVCSTILSCMSPSTPLQKEIRNEEWTIKQLKKQKADMQRLKALTKEREALFEDVGEQYAERVEVKRNGEWSEPRDSVYPSSLQSIKQDGKEIIEVGYTDNTVQVFHEDFHNLKKVEFLWYGRKPIIEEEVRL